MLQVNSMEDVPTEVLDEPDDEFDNVEPSDGQFPDMPASVEETPDALDWCSLFNIQKEIWEKLGHPFRNLCRPVHRPFHSRIAAAIS